jgi:hypothetical protein
MGPTFPAVLTTVVETQHRRAAFCGSTIFHQPPSVLRPVICELCPTIKALIATHAVLGPSLQLTFTSFGKATGIVGVDVNVGGGVLLGRGVCVGRSVATGCVTVEEGNPVMWVSVAWILDGRLQASIARTSISTGNKVRGFIVSPLISESYPILHRMTIDHLDSILLKSGSGSALYYSSTFITGYGGPDLP